MSAAPPANFNPEEADNLEDVRIFYSQILPPPYKLLTCLQMEKQFAVKGSRLPGQIFQLPR
jgi:hypothetical protein